MTTPYCLLYDSIKAETIEYIIELSVPPCLDCAKGIPHFVPLSKTSCHCLQDRGAGFYANSASWTFVSDDSTTIIVTVAQRYNKNKYH